MPPIQDHLPSKRQLLAAAIAMAIQGTAYASAGKVNFAFGDVTAISVSGESRKLTKGGIINSGDTIETGKNGIAQLRFTDGAYVSLQKNSTFRVDEYNYNGKTDGKEKGFFSLLKGGFRTITGLIGKGQKDRYQVRTAVATIGIRGTEYIAELGNSITITVTEGGIEICNNAGCNILREGETGYISNINSIIQKLKEQGITVTTTEQDGETVYTIGDDVTDDGLTKIIVDEIEAPGPVVPDCSAGNCYIAFSGQAIGEGPFIGYGYDVTGAFSGAALTEYSFLDNGSEEAGGAGIGTTTATSAGSNSNLAWGIWFGGTTTSTGGTPGPWHPHPGTYDNTVDGAEAFHYVIGTPTPDINNLTGTFDYSIAGFTNPTASNNGPLGSFNGLTGSANVTFGGVPDLSLNFTLDFANADYNVHADTASGIYFGQAEFWGYASATGGLPAFSGYTTCDFTGCPTQVEGFFAGNQGENIGLGYLIGDDAGVGNVTGTVVYGNQQPGTPLPPQ